MVPLLRRLTARPPWVHDVDVRACGCCGDSFSTRHRRHHCRHCGRVVCAACSKHRVAIAKFELPKPVRVCTLCFDVLSFRRME